MIKLRVTGSLAVSVSSVLTICDPNFQNSHMRLESHSSHEIEH